MLTNIPTPYRVAFFDTLGTELAVAGGRLEVFYCADTEPGRQWKFNDDTRGGTRIPGASPRIRGDAFHLNPTATVHIRKVDPDWLLVGGSWNTPTMIAVSALERRRVPRVFWSEGHMAAVRHRSGPIARARALVLNSFDGFAVPNQRSEDFIRTQTRRSQPIVRLPNTVDEGFFDPTAVDTQSVRSRLGLPPGARVLVIVASLEPRKRVLESVQAFNTVAQSWPDLHLVVVGSGPQKAEIEHAASGSLRVHFVGQREAEEVRDILASAEGFLLASSYDPNPLSVIEAALCGCFLMTTQAVGNSEELVHASGGTVISDAPGTDVGAELALAIRAFALRSTEDISSSGLKTRQFALAHYTRKTVARSLITSLDRLWPPGG